MNLAVPLKTERDAVSLKTERDTIAELMEVVGVQSQQIELICVMALNGGGFINL